MKKAMIFSFGLFLVINLFVVSVVGKLSVETNVINNIVISEMKNPAIFELIIKNEGESDKFSIYSLANVEVDAPQEIYIPTGGERKIEVRVIPHDILIEKGENIFPFVLKVRGEKGSLEEVILSMKILKLNEAIKIGGYDIYPLDDNAEIYVENKVNLTFSNVEAKFHSIFFDFEKNFSLKGLERKEFTTPIQQKEGIEAGTYILMADVNADGIKSTLEGVIRFKEETMIETTTKKEGILLRKYVVEKKNIGNLPEVVEIKIQKNIISRLFVNFNVEPYKVEREGNKVYYYFKKEIRPAESFVVIATTNLLYPIFIILLLVLIIWILYIYTYNDVIIEKRARYIKTKGDEFAIKVYINIKARKFVEKISVVEKIPSLFTIYKDFEITPDKIDEKNRRIEWYLENLQGGEERKFSYIIYTKVAPVGKTELPPTTVIYEREGNVKESMSNKVYFLTEIKKER